MSTAAKKLTRQQPGASANPILKSIVIDNAVCIPGWVTDLASFRLWSQSTEFPDHGRIDFLDGEIWVDMSMEEFLTHNQVKGELAVVLGNLIKAARLGRYIHDRMRLTKPTVGLSVEPDGAFASWETLRSKRLQLRKSGSGGCLELEGTPEMVLEVVSNSSVHKDTRTLPAIYSRAEITEFWLVDGRDEPLKFDIFRHTSRGFVAVKKHQGWLKALVFQREFNLSVQPDPLGQPEYLLLVR